MKKKFKLIFVLTLYTYQLVAQNSANSVDIGSYITISDSKKGNTVYFDYNRLMRNSKYSLDFGFDYFDIENSTKNEINTDYKIYGVRAGLGRNIKVNKRDHSIGFALMFGIDRANVLVNDDSSYFKDRDKEFTLIGGSGNIKINYNFNRIGFNINTTYKSVDKLSAMGVGLSYRFNKSKGENIFGLNRTVKIKKIKYYNGYSEDDIDTVIPSSANPVINTAIPQYTKSDIDKNIITPNRHNSIAIIVGNNNYDGDLHLKGIPKKDAIAMDKKLEECGFKTILLIDKSRKEILDVLSTISKDSKDIESILFYYSGHAVKLGYEYLIMPIDEIIDPYEAEYYLDVQAVFRRFSKIDAKVKIVILDACRREIKLNEGSGEVIKQSNSNGVITMYAVEDRIGLKVNSDNNMSIFTENFIDLIDEGDELKDFMQKLYNRMFIISPESCPAREGELLNNTKFFFKHEDR